MAWTSILPSSLSTLETWLVNFFLLSAAVTIGPWLVFVIYDIILYFVRTIAHEFPFFGGRAQGQQPPRAPSLSERPDGRPRRFSLAAPAGTATGRDAPALVPRQTAQLDGEDLKDSMFD